jgi:hypothetical protein
MYCDFKTSKHHHHPLKKCGGGVEGRGVLKTRKTKTTVTVPLVDGSCLLSK